MRSTPFTITETQLVCSGCGRRKWVKLDPPTEAEHNRLLAWWRSAGRRCKECRETSPAD